MCWLFSLHLVRHNHHWLSTVVLQTVGDSLRRLHSSSGQACGHGYFLSRRGACRACPKCPEDVEVAAECEDTQDSLCVNRSEGFLKIGTVWDPCWDFFQWMNEWVHVWISRRVNERVKRRFVRFKKEMRMTQDLLQHNTEKNVCVCTQKICDENPIRWCAHTTRRRTHAFLSVICT